METNLLILGKGDNIITMILDNLYSNLHTPNIIIYNNLNLPTVSPFIHFGFNMTIFNEVDLNE